MVRAEFIALMTLSCVCLTCGGKSNSFKIKLIIDHKFRGRLWINPSSDKWDPTETYTIDGRSGSVGIPSSALHGNIAVIEVQDENGKILSREHRYNEGDVGVTGIGVRNEQWYFDIDSLK